MVRQARLPVGSQNNTNRMDTLKSKLTHQPCEDCGSSDALTINTDGSTKCYSCATWRSGRSNTYTVTPKETKPSDFLSGNTVDIPVRGLTKDICKKYGYHVATYNGEACHVANYRNTDGELVAQKLRFKDKRFQCKGAPNVFFGQHLWPNGGRMLVVTEGEVDCLSVAMANGDGKWPVVSLPNGAQSAKSIFKAQFPWLDMFETVVLMFDEDEQGRKASEAVSHLLPAGKTKIARLTMKDPNELLLANRKNEIVSAMWDAKPWKPDAITDGVDLYERLTTPKNNKSVDYPFRGLNRLTHGLRRGEIVTFAAGSGVGKSHVCKIIAHNLLKNDHKVGYIALEESLERTANSIIGLEMEKLIHLDPDFQATDEYNEAFKATVGSGRCFLYDHWGSLDSDNLIGHIRYMAKVMEVEYVVLDHLSIVISGLHEGDERRIIDNTMTKLRSLVEETKIGMILVSHLKRPEGKGHEEGASTSLAQLRGSAAIAQLSDICCGLERNGQCPDNKNKTLVRVLKNRFSGETGIACALNYDPTTGLMAEEHYCENPF
tara:strand:+ start:9550 stop:11187 length:1638 start_codon:yes stop_codon:yes gene_type:complete